MRILVEGPSQVRDTGLNATDRERCAARLLERLERPRLAQALRLQQVLGGALGRRSLVRQRAGRPHVGAGPSAWHQRAVDRGAHDGVPEAQPRPAGFEDLRAAERVGHLERRQVVEPCHARGAGLGGAVPQNGGGFRQLTGARREALEAAGRWRATRIRSPA